MPDLDTFPGRNASVSTQQLLDDFADSFNGGISAQGAIESPTSALSSPVSEKTNTIKRDLFNLNKSSFDFDL